MRDESIFLIPPCEGGFITQNFGEHPEIYRQFGQPGHTGRDYGINIGTPLHPMADGIVDKIAEEAGGFGKYVKLRHNSPRGVYYTYLAHMSKIDVMAGQLVRTTDPIGKSGNTGFSTGPHVHCELRVPWDVAQNYINSVSNIDLYFIPPINPPGPPPEPVDMVIVTASNLNVRVSPGITSTSVGYAKRGIALELTGKEVESGGRTWLGVTLYVAKEFTKPL